MKAKFNCKNIFIKIHSWSWAKKIDALFWLITGILLIVLIALFVSFAPTYSQTISESSKILTDLAIMQQNVTAAIALLFAIFLTFSIFTLVISLFLKRKKER